MKKNTQKWLKIFAVLVLVCVLAAAFVACNEPEPEPEPEQPKTYTITVVETIVNGSVTVSKSSAKAGEKITVTATPNEHYLLDTLTQNGLPITNGEFVMGEGNVVVNATFKFDASKFEVDIGENGGTLISASSMGGSTANAQLFANFSDEAIELVAYVRDSDITEKDGVAVSFSKLEPVIGALLPDGKTIKLMATIGGEPSIMATDAEGKLVAKVIEGATIYAKLWSIDGLSATGYLVRASLPYTALGLTAETAKGAVSICPVVYNAYGSMVARATTLEGVKESAQNTYPIMLDSNSFAPNPFVMGSGQLGSAGGLTAAETWDLSKDYYSVDENYDNRVVTLTGHDGADNNLMFYGVSANEMYARATITLTGVANANDQWPKFGMMLFNGGSQSGVFFYVDAAMSQGSGNTLDNLTGKGIGFNKGVDSWGSWNYLRDNVFNLETKTVTLEMVYQDGWLHMYANGAFVQTVYAGEYNESMHFGFKSFGLEMQVTDYLASDDAEADGWADKKKVNPETRDVEILFAGDSYMDFWKSRYQSAHLAGYVTEYANEGIGGTQVPLWITKVDEMKLLYNPEKIAFHIGVNDIDGGASVATTVANLITMFESYHGMFPEATLYWNSLIPNTMFANKVADYYAVNEQIQAWMADKEWVVYINQTPSFEASEGVANPMYFDDGLHLSTDIGYPLWVKNMLTAMGYTRVDGDVMGDVDGFAHSGWTFGEGTSHMSASTANEMITYIKGVSGAEFYVEVKVAFGDLYNNDGYPKVGVVAHGTTQSMWGILDTIGYPTNTANPGAAWVQRGVAYNGAISYYTGWNWSGSNGPIYGAPFQGAFRNGEYVTLAIARYQGKLYLIANGSVLVSRDMPEDIVAVGFQTFNVEADLKDVVVSTELSVIKSALGLPSVADVDGATTDDIWTEEVLANSIKMGDKNDGRYFEVVGVKASDGIYMYVTTYSHENTRPLSGNWWENANVEFRFGNDTGTQFYYYYVGPGFTTTASSANVSASAAGASEQLESGLYKASAEFFVPYASIAGYDANSAEIPVYIWGWVFDEGWKDCMNVGGFPLLTVSEHGLRWERSVSVEGNNAAVTVTPSAVKGFKGDTITLTVETDKEIDKITITPAGGTEQVLEAVEGAYSFTMPDANVTVKVTLKGISVTSKVEGIAGKATVSCEVGIATIGQVVPFTVACDQGYVITSVKVNGNTVNGESGAYSYTVLDTDEGVEIVVTTDYNLEGFAIDGEKNSGELYGEELNFLVEDNRSVSVWAKKGEYGVYLYVLAYTNTLINDNSVDWWLNHNFEFWLNMGPQSYVNSRNEKNNVTLSSVNSVLVADGEYKGKYEHRMELFVHKNLIANFDSGDVQLNYAFKAPNELAWWEDTQSCTMSKQDWWRTHLGNHDACEIDFGVFAVPSWLKITDDGIINTKPETQDATIDANLTEYEGKTGITAQGANVFYDVKGFRGEDGVYLAFEIYQNTRSNNAEGYFEADGTTWNTGWWKNDNIEIYVNGQPCGFTILDKGRFVSSFGNVHSIESRTETGTYEKGTGTYTNKTIVEMFVRIITSEPIAVRLGSNGEGFGGWTAIAWDNNYVIPTADGLVAGPIDYSVPASEGLTLDGVLDESFYTDRNIVTRSVNGATVKMSAVVLEKGIVFAIAIDHTKAPTHVIQGDGTQWWNMLDVEIWLGRETDAFRSEASVPVTGSTTPIGNRCSVGVASSGADSAYTTIFEIYIPLGTTITGDIPFKVAGVIETGYVVVCDWGNVRLTADGLVE